MSSPIGDAIKSAITAIIPATDKYDFDVVWEEIGKVLDGIADTVGAIKMYAGAVMPTRWLLCDGRTIGKTGSGAALEGEAYHALFDVIQNLYGGGAGPVWDDGDVVNIPDFAGIFPRGAGVHHSLTRADGTSFMGSTGAYQNDKMQGHWHLLPNTTGAVSGPFSEAAGSFVSTTSNPPITDGVNGAPRTGNETNPANLSVPFIIRY